MPRSVTIGMKRRLDRLVVIVFFLNLSVMGSDTVLAEQAEQVVQAAQATQAAQAAQAGQAAQAAQATQATLATQLAPAERAQFAQTDPADPPTDLLTGPLADQQPTDALDELLQTVEAAEGVSERSKRQLRDRLLRLSERMDRLGPGVDRDAVVVAELEALRSDAPELSDLLDAIFAAHEAGHSFDEILAVLTDFEPDAGALDDAALARIVKTARQARLDEEAHDALLAALQTEPRAFDQLNRGQVVSTMAHVRNLQRQARRDGIELTDEQLTQLVKEGLSGYFSDEEIEAITEAALNSGRGMSEAVGQIRNAVPPQGKEHGTEQGKRQGKERRDSSQLGAAEGNETSSDNHGSEVGTDAGSGSTTSGEASDASNKKEAGKGKSAGNSKGEGGPPTASKGKKK